MSNTAIGSKQQATWPEGCRRVMKIRATPAADVLSGPNILEAVITRLDHGERVCVAEVDRRGLWYRISLPVAGWVAAGHLEEVGS